jgi:hypothetical protein
LVERRRLPLGTVNLPSAAHQGPMGAIKTIARNTEDKENENNKNF